MKRSKIIGLIGAVSIAFGPAGWAAGHGGGGGGGFGSTFSGGGHFGGGGARPGGSAVRSGGGRPAYFYSRGMNFGGGRNAVTRSTVQQSRPSVMTNRRSNPGIVPRGTNGTVANSVTRPGQSAQRAPLNGRTDHISERHNAGNWHNDWDRRRAHFAHNRFFVFDNGFWFGLDPGFFPWDYYPYYAYDYYPYDYYPGYYADVEPYYYNEGVYSETPVQDPTVSSVQSELTQLGYYTGPIDGIYGPTTRDAVAKYQIAKQLDVNGSLSAQTLQSLGVQPTAG
jgi:hypothetical protein